MSKLVVSNGQHRHHVSSKPGMWTAGQVCNRLFVSAMWLYRKLKSDATFPRPIKLGVRNFWRVEVIERWLKQQEVAPQSSSLTRSISKRTEPPCHQAAAGNDTPDAEKS